MFFDEREKLIDFFDSLGRPVLVLTGDLHNSFAIKITDAVWEFASGPHNSNNLLATDEGGRPANGRFKYGPREVEIRWSNYFRSDIPRSELLHPHFAVVQVNNVFNNPRKLGGTRWVAFPKPQVVVQYFDGRSGELRYAEAIVANLARRVVGRSRHPVYRATALGFPRHRSVMASSMEVDHILRAGGEAQPGEAHRGAHHVPDERLELAPVRSRRFGAW